MLQTLERRALDTPSLPMELSSPPAAPPRTTVADAVVRLLADLGVGYAFGVSGGAMATLWAALSRSAIQVRHFRHEGGAAFAAIEAYFASQRPVVVFTTAGPGLTNALTGLLAARDEGAKIIVLSACTSAAQRGRWAIQETAAATMPGDLYQPGPLFHYATILESAEVLPQVARRLAHGLARPGGFVAHLSLPTGLQASECLTPCPEAALEHVPQAPAASTLATCARRLTAGPCALWLGFGARHAAGAVRELATRLGAAVMCSPRAKGIFPEDHPQFVGVTGMGGHRSVLTYMHEQPPLWSLVLGTRLGEPTSFWNPLMIPQRGFIHVDIDPEVPGVAYPSAHTLAVQAEVGAFVTALLPYLPQRGAASHATRYPRPELPALDPAAGALVRPEALMAAVQRVVIEAHEALVLAESGNAFTWASHLLQFKAPGRYRVSTGIGAMGHATTGVVGAALGRGGKAVALVGDGAMLMHNEINTAVKFDVPAVWIVLNDARYNMCEQGMAILGLQADAAIPEVDFALLARALGADGLRVEREADLPWALTHALAAPGPFVLDVRLDPTRVAPAHGRNRGLRGQIATVQAPAQVSFPCVS